MAPRITLLAVTLVLVLCFSLGIWTALEGCDYQGGAGCSNWHVFPDAVETARSQTASGGVVITLDWYQQAPDGVKTYYTCAFCSDADAPPPPPAGLASQLIGTVLSYTDAAKKRMTQRCLWRPADLDRAASMQAWTWVLWVAFSLSLVALIVLTGPQWESCYWC